MKELEVIWKKNNVIQIMCHNSNFKNHHLHRVNYRIWFVSKEIIEYLDNFTINNIIILKYLWRNVKIQLYVNLMMKFINLLTKGIVIFIYK